MRKVLTKEAKAIISFIFVISTLVFALNMDKIIIVTISLIISFISYILLDFYGE